MAINLNLRYRISCLLFLLPLSSLGSLAAAPIRVRFQEGAVHGYLALRSKEGKIIAGGDLIQFIRGDRVTSRLTFHFRDGSLDDETAVFTQRGHFKLLTDHHIQKGPSYKEATDVSIDTLTGQVTNRYTEDGRTKVDKEHMNLPPDLGNGMIINLLKNVPPEAKETKISYLATTPKVRLVKFAISPVGSDAFWVAGIREKAVRFIVKVDLGGLAGMFAPLLGKQPADTTVWVAADEVPAFVRSECELYLGGPTWTIEMTGPVWH